LQKKYKSSLAEIIMELMHPLSDKQMREPETYETLIAHLNDDKIAVRELAYTHLSALVPQGRDIPYDPAGTTEQREYSYQQWKKLIPTGKLPPSPSQAPPGSKPTNGTNKNNRTGK